jgi:hypothetical protein
MIGRDVVRDEVEDQRQPSLCELAACDRQARVAPEPLVDRVAADAVRGADDVLLGGVGQHGRRRGGEGGIRQRDAAAERAALPDPHQPHGVDARYGEGVPVGRGDVPERDATVVTLREPSEPRPGEELVDHEPT